MLIVRLPSTTTVRLRGSEECLGPDLADLPEFARWCREKQDAT